MDVRREVRLWVAAAFGLPVLEVENPLCDRWMSPLARGTAPGLDGGPCNLRACSCPLSFEDRQPERAQGQTEKNKGGRGGDSTRARDALSALPRKRPLHSGGLLLPVPGSVGSQGALGPGSKSRAWTVRERARALQPLPKRIRARIHLMRMFLPLVRMTIAFELFTMRKKNFYSSKKKSESRTVIVSGNKCSSLRVPSSAACKTVKNVSGLSAPPPQAHCEGNR